MSTKLYRFYCEICNWKKITDGADTDKLYEYKTSGLQKNIPKLDKLTKKTVPTEFRDQPRKFRCPNCGRPVIARKISNPQETIDQKNEIEERQKDPDG